MRRDNSCATWRSDAPAALPPGCALVRADGIRRMLAAIEQSALIAVGLLLAALPMVLIALVLAAKRPARVSWAFLGGWMLGLVVAGAIVIALVDVLEVSGASPRWVGYLKIALGVVLLLLGLRKGVARIRSVDVPEMPRW